MENDRIIEENERQEIENLWLKKILKVFAIRSSGGVYNGLRWEPRVDPKNPRPLLVHTGNLMHALRHAEVTWNGEMDFTAAIEERQYPAKPVTTREVFYCTRSGQKPCQPDR